MVSSTKQSCRPESVHLVQGQPDQNLECAVDLSKIIACYHLRSNISGELGGALFSAGKLYINATKFTGNASGKDGLAIYNFQSSDISLDATFEGNTFSCLSGEYSDVHHAEVTIMVYASPKLSANALLSGD